VREGGGIDSEVKPVDPSHRIGYDPRDAKTNEDGLVAAPNVNLEENLVGPLPGWALGPTLFYSLIR